MAVFDPNDGVGARFSRVLHIGRIPLDIDKTKFESLFEKCGDIQSIKLIGETKDGKYQFGKVKYFTMESMLTAMSMYNFTSPYRMSVCLEHINTTTNNNDISFNSLSDHSQTTKFDSIDFSEEKDVLLPNIMKPRTFNFQPTGCSLNISNVTQKPNVLERESHDYPSKHRNLRDNSGVRRNNPHRSELFQQYMDLKLDPSLYDSVPVAGNRDRGVRHASEYYEKPRSTLQKDSLVSNASMVKNVQHDVPKLLPDQKTKVTITSIHDPYNFYVRTSSVDKLIDALNAVCPSAPKLAEASLNQIVGVLNQKENNWFRGKLIERSFKDNFKVLLIDYGSVVDVSAANIRKLPQYLISIPNQALHCRLYNVTPSDSSEWSDDKVKLFELIAWKQAWLAIGIEKDGQYWVRLVDKDNMDIGVILSKSLGFSLCSPIHQSSIQLWENEVNISAICTTNEENGSLWIIDNSKNLKIVQESLNKKLDDQLELFACSSTCVGSIVAAKKLTADQKWYRAVIVEVHSKGYTVQLIDFGNEEFVEIVQPLPFYLELFHSMAINLNPIKRSKFNRNKQIKKCSRISFNCKQVMNEEIFFVELLNEDNRSFIASSLWYQFDDNFLNNLTICKVSEEPTLITSESLRNPAVNPNGTKVSQPQVLRQASPIILPEPLIPSTENMESFILLNFVNCDERRVFVQVKSEEIARDSEKLSSKLSEACEQLLANEQTVTIEVSHYGCGKVEDCGPWFRCKVIKYLSADKVRVRLVDLGKAATISTKYLVDIPEEFASIPVLAIEVTLADIEPGVLNKIREYLVYLKNLNWQMKVVESSTTPIQVILSSTENKLFKHLIRRFFQPEDLDEEQDAAGTSAGPEKKIMSTYHYNECAITRLPIGETVEVTFCTIISPLVLYCWYGNETEISKEMDNLTDRMTEYTDAEIEEHGAFSYKPSHVGQICIARHKDDGKWYRASVLAIHESSCFTIFVDYGNCSEVEFENLRPISPEFMKSAFQAVPCTLHGVSPDRTFSNEDCEEFRNLVEEGDCHAIEVVNCDDDIYSIRIPRLESRLESFKNP